MIRRLQSVGNFLYFKGPFSSAMFDRNSKEQVIALIEGENVVVDYDDNLTEPATVD
jgi:hypothetical protein